MKTSIKILAYLAFLATLVACGGGGGDTTPPTVQPPVDVTITAPLSTPNNALVVQQDLSTVPATFNWQASAAVSLKCGATTVATSAAGPATANLPLGTTSCQLFDGVKALGSAITLNVTCVPGTDGLTGTCKAPTVVRYGETLIGYWGITNGRPRKTMPDGTQVNMVNKTKYASFLNCLPVANNQKNADGTVPHSCLATFGSDRYNDIALNPVTMEMVDAPAPVGVTYIPQTYDASRNPANRPTWATSAHFQSGNYAFADQATASVVRLLSTTGMESVLYAGTFAGDGSCFLLMIFSNP